MRTKHKNLLKGTKSYVQTDLYQSIRFLLDEDRLGITLTDISLEACPTPFTIIPIIWKLLIALKAGRN